MKRCISLLIVLCLLFMISGCLLYRHEEDNDYDSNIIELEEFILDELEDYIYFYSVDLDPYVNPRYYSKGDCADILIAFKKDYIRDKSLLSEKPPMQIVSRFRDLYNLFMAENPNYYICGYSVSCRFCYYRRSTASLQYAELSNMDQYFMPYGDELSTLEVIKQDDTDVDFPFGEWDYFYLVTDLKAIFLNDEYTLEEAVELSDNMPFLEYVIVPTDEIAQEASELRPGVIFVKSEIL